MKDRLKEALQEYCKATDYIISRHSQDLKLIKKISFILFKCHSPNFSLVFLQFALPDLGALVVIKELAKFIVELGSDCDGALDIKMFEFIYESVIFDVLIGQFPCQKERLLNVVKNKVEIHPGVQ